MRPKQRLSSWGVSWTSAGLFASDVVLYYLAFYRAKLGRFCGRFFAGCCFGASWVPAWALGECCGFGSAAATVAGAGVDPLRDPWVVNLVDLRQLRQLLRGVLPKDLRRGSGLPWKAAGLPGYQRGPWVSAADPDPRLIAAAGGQAHIDGPGRGSSSAVFSRCASRISITACPLLCFRKSL